MNPDLSELLEIGSVHGAGLPERLLIEKTLLESGMAEELFAWRKLTAFVPAEEILSALNVASFARTVGKLDGSVTAKGISLGWNAEVEPDTNKDTVPSPGYPQGPDYPKTPRRKPVPIGADLSAILRADPLAKSFEAVNGRVMVDGSTMVRFIDGSGKSKIRRVAVRKPKVAPALKATAPTAEAPAKVAAPTPIDLAAAAAARGDWKALWQHDPNIREEFISAEVYASFKKAESEGRVRICGLKRN